MSAASQIFAAGGGNSDNPTNLGVSDFSLVAATLDTNNARLIGVKKLLVIDMETRRGNMAQAIEKCAA